MFYLYCTFNLYIFIFTLKIKDDNSTQAQWIARVWLDKMVGRTGRAQCYIRP